MKKTILVLILLVCLIGTVILLLVQDKPGKHEWFHRFSGDWSIELQNGYEIGPSPTSAKDHFQVIKSILVKTSKDGTKYAPQIVANEIISYCVADDLIILKSTEKWVLLNTATGERATFNDAAVPEQLKEHTQNMKVPKPSERNRLWFLVFLLTASLVFLLVKELTKAKKTAEELDNYPKTPGSLAEAIEALEKDHKFLTVGGVFTDDLVEGWIKWKRQEELNPLALRPHPYEFHLYYDS